MGAITSRVRQTKMKSDSDTPATISELLLAQASAQPDAPALLAPQRPPLSYSALQNQVQALARELHARGVTASTRVGVLLPNGPEAAAAILGVAACAACAPLNPALQAAELRADLRSLRIELMMILRGQTGPIRDVARDLALPLLEIEVNLGAPAGQFECRAALPAVVPAAVPAPLPCKPLDLALLLQTSGTTARPKVVPLSQANLVASARGIAAHLALAPQDRCLNVMPLFHIHGLVGTLLATLAAGGSIVCTPGFDGEAFFRWTAQLEPTWYSAVPTIHQAVLAHGAAYRQEAPAHRFRFVRSSSAALPGATLRQLEGLLGAPVVEAYGMTEASHQMASNLLGKGAQTPGSVGVAAGAQIAILGPAGEFLSLGQPGEIAVRGPGVMAGYEDNPQANAEAFADGWFRTGDLGHLDAQERLFITGRLKEMVNRAGEKISPREIDEVLLEHECVAQAAAFGVPHASLGEDLAAVVVLRAGARVGEAELRAFLFTRLAEFKVPSQIIFLSTIPTGATGKVQRTQLHQTMSAALTRPFVAPDTPLERSLERIFCEVLECSRLGAHDNFFARGGDSLRGARVMARVNLEFGVALPTIALFRHPSLSELAQEVQRLLAQRRAGEAALQDEIDSLSDDEVARLLAQAEALDAKAAGAEPARLGTQALA